MEIQIQERLREVEKGQLLRNLLPSVMLIVLVLVISSVQSSFLSPISLRTLLESAAPIALIALGQTLVILTGGIDLSLAVLTSLGTVILALTLNAFGGVGILVTIALITGMGVLNGFVTAFAQIPSFVVTLGSMGLWSGIALVISGASTVSIGANYDAIAWLTETKIGGLSLSVYMALVAAVIIALAIRVHKRGNALHAIGRAETAALMSGLKTRRARILAFGGAAFFSSIAAMVLASSQYSGNPTLADSLLLPAIAAVIVGGTAITGGVGGPFGTVIGALIIVVLRVGMTSLGVDPAYEQVVYGAVIVIAVAITLDRKRLGVIK